MCRQHPMQRERVTAGKREHQDAKAPRDRGEHSGGVRVALAVMVLRAERNQ